VQWAHSVSGVGISSSWSTFFPRPTETSLKSLLPVTAFTETRPAPRRRRRRRASFNHETESVEVFDPFLGTHTATGNSLSWPVIEIETSRTCRSVSASRARTARRARPIQRFRPDIWVEPPCRPSRHIRPLEESDPFARWPWNVDRGRIALCRHNRNLDSGAELFEAADRGRALQGRPPTPGCWFLPLPSGAQHR